MSRLQRTVGITVLLVLAVLRPICADAQDTVPPLVQISGDLSDQKGKPLSGAQTVTFALYMGQSGDAPLWVEVQVVTADAKGHFIALLGATSPGGLPLNLFTTGQARWLGMQASGQAELPRTFLASVPYALAPLSALTGSGQPVTSDASTNSPLTTAPLSGAASTVSPAVAATAPIVPVSPPVPIATVVTDSTSGLTSSKSGSTVTLSLMTGCAPGQLLKWNGTAWGCTADSDVTIDVTGGGLNVLANATSPNIVGGYGGNAVTSGAFGATIGGGGESKPGGGLCPPFPAPCNANNRVAQSFGTVAGGESNQAGDSTGVAATRSYATVGGGRSNAASGLFSTVPGGNQNTAAGTSSFAAGFNAQANHNGAFVWSDSSSSAPFASTAANQFLLRASGGVGIGTNAPTTTLDVRGHVNLQDAGGNGVVLFPSSGAGLFIRSGGDTSYTERLFISGSTGQVGIGTTAPTQALDVAGNVRAAGDVIGTNRLCIGSDCRTAWPTSGGGGLGGSGTPNALAKFSNASTLAPSAVSDDGSNVVIGVNAGGLRVLSTITQAPNIIGGHLANSVMTNAYGVTIAGGGESDAPNQGDAYAAVGGGSGNTAGYFGTVSGGSDNTASGRTAAVPGGLENVAAGFASFAAGEKAHANHDGTFVWNNDPLSTFTSTSNNQFLIRALGGVGIVNRSDITSYTPTETLDVVGNVKADGLCIGSDCRTAWPSGGGTITGVTGTGGLTGGGTSGTVSLGVDFTATQARVSGTCALGMAIQSVNADGTVACAPASSGLAGSGGVNLVSRFTSPNTLGSGSIFDDGTRVGIGTTTPTATLHVRNNAGNFSTYAGFFETNTGSAGVFGQAGDPSQDGPVLQNVNGVAGLGYGLGSNGVSGTGDAGVYGQGQSYGVIGVSQAQVGVGGAFSNLDPNGKALVTYTNTQTESLSVLASGKVGIFNTKPGEALDVNGNVKATMFIGDGSLLTNLPSGGGGTITGVTAGAGLSGGGTSGSVPLAIANAGVTNAMLQNNALTINAGLGLSGGGSVSLGSAEALSVDFTAAQKRVTGTCPSGFAIQGVNGDGTVGCGPAGGLGGFGPPNAIAKFLDNGTVGPARIIDDGGKVIIGSNGGGLVIINPTDGSTPNMISGGRQNNVDLLVYGATISGGGDNSAPDGLNSVSAHFGTIGGGESNTVNGQNGTVAGGQGNTSSEQAAVGGGFGNAASGKAAAIAGGQSNTASGPSSTVPGGSNNSATGAFSFAAGQGAAANHHGAFVWADSSDLVNQFATTGPDQFLIRAVGGVGIGTNSPTQAVDVAGNVKANGLCIGTDCRTAWPSGGTGTITGVTAGTGLIGGGTTGNLQLAVDSGAIQVRVLGACATGSAVQSVNQDGTVNCGAAGAAGIGGSGTKGTISRFTDTNTVGDSQITDDGTFSVAILPGLNSGQAGAGGIQIVAGGISPNIVGGFWRNAAGGAGSTIGGGGQFNLENRVHDSFGTIGGGYNNNVGLAGPNSSATDLATVGGGRDNTASGGGSTVGGGFANTASGLAATVPGGQSNTAAGDNSFAAGTNAAANNSGAFVWADNSVQQTFASTASNQFNVRAAGGVRIFSNGTLTAGVTLAPGSGSWSLVSDRNAKDNFALVDGAALLKKLNAISFQTWNYKSQDAAIRHMGPMAQDFHAAFGLGEDEKHISSVDANGVALAGVQALYRMLLQKDDEIVQQRKDLQKLEAQIDALRAALNQLTGRDKDK